MVVFVSRRGFTGGGLQTRLFLSLQDQTTYDQTIILTYSPQSTGTLQLYAKPEHRRILLRTNARFSLYRPRKGLDNDLRCLAYDTGKKNAVAVVCLVPQHAMRCLCWHGEQLDVSKSIVQILRANSGTMLSLAAFTAELELDIARAAQRPCTSTCIPWQ